MSTGYDCLAVPESEFRSLSVQGLPLGHRSRSPCTPVQSVGDFYLRHAPSLLKLKYQGRRTLAPPYQGGLSRDSYVSQCLRVSSLVGKRRDPHGE